MFGHKTSFCTIVARTKSNTSFILQDTPQLRLALTLPRSDDGDVADLLIAVQSRASSEASANAAAARAFLRRERRKMATTTSSAAATPAATR